MTMEYIKRTEKLQKDYLNCTTNEKKIDVMIKLIFIINCEIGRLKNEKELNEVLECVDSIQTKEEYDEMWKKNDIYKARFN